MNWTRAEAVNWYSLESIELNMEYTTAEAVSITEGGGDQRPFSMFTQVKRTRPRSVNEEVSQGMQHILSSIETVFKWLETIGIDTGLR